VRPFERALIGAGASPENPATCIDPSGERRFQEWGASTDAMRPPSSDRVEGPPEIVARVEVRLFEVNDVNPARRSCHSSNPRCQPVRKRVKPDAQCACACYCTCRSLSRLSSSLRCACAFGEWSCRNYADRAGLVPAVLAWCEVMA
jgi:hypothetical protein